MKKNIAGIQQVGIGVPDVNRAFDWYRRVFGMDVKVFEEAAQANLMLPYTGGEPQSRHAILAINMKGGGGFEIWQYTSRTPRPADFELKPGDLGIFSARIKSHDVRESHRLLKQRNIILLSEVNKDPAGNESFFLKDPYGNIFQVVSGTDWFWKGKELTGGIEGCIIGVSDIDRARELYSGILGYDEVVYDRKGKFEDFAVLPGGNSEMRRVLLRHSKVRLGSFSRLLGESRIELVQVYDRKPEKIFRNRYWGDLGFIHLCFDVTGMATLKKECEARGFPFTVDSANSFDMGEAAGHFSYIEDGDGTLIEFVETHKVPVMKKLGLYLNLKKRNPEKSLPDWMVKALVLNRVKE